MNTLTKVLGPAVRIGVGAVLGCYLTAGCRPASTTAQEKPDAEGNPPSHAWFVGYAPYKDPEIVVVVLVQGGGEGSSAAVPVARDIFNWYFAQKK